MAEKVHAGDFIELDFIARIKSSNKIFDLTKRDVAKKEGIFQEDREYKPLVVCLGAGHLLKGLDRALEAREIGKEINIEVQPEDAFGRKNPKLMQLTTTKQFKDKGVTPVPGLQLAIDGAIATIRSVSGGRVIIDFNHPLAGKTLKYWVKINKKVTDTEQKIASIVSLLTGLGEADYSINITDKNINIDIQKDTPKETLEAIKKQIINFIPEVSKKELKINIKVK